MLENLPAFLRAFSSSYIGRTFWILGAIDIAAMILSWVLTRAAKGEHAERVDAWAKSKRLWFLFLILFVAASFDAYDDLKRESSREADTLRGQLTAKDKEIHDKDQKITSLDGDLRAAEREKGRLEGRLVVKEQSLEDARAEKKVTLALPPTAQIEPIPAPQEILPSSEIVQSPDKEFPYAMRAVVQVKASIKPITLHFYLVGEPAQDKLQMWGTSDIHQSIIYASWPKPSEYLITVPEGITPGRPLVLLFMSKGPLGLRRVNIVGR